MISYIPNIISLWLYTFTVYLIHSVIQIFYLQIASFAPKYKLCKYFYSSHRFLLYLLIFCSIFLYFLFFVRIFLWQDVIVCRYLAAGFTAPYGYVRATKLFPLLPRLTHHATSLLQLNENEKTNLKLWRKVRPLWPRSFHGIGTMLRL